MSCNKNMWMLYIGHESSFSYLKWIFIAVAAAAVATTTQPPAITNPQVSNNKTRQKDECKILCEIIAI